MMKDDERMKLFTVSDSYPVSPSRALLFDSGPTVNPIGIASST